MKIKLPQVGESVTEGAIGKWLKEVGDRVEKYDPLVEVITDKVNMEMPSPVAGVLTSILVPEGETVPMGAVIAEIAAEGEELAAAAPEPPPPAPVRVDRIGTLLKDAAPVGPTGSGGPISADAGAQRYSPAVSRLAAERGVDLAALTGTGIGGRVTRKDVQAAIDSRTVSEAAPADTPADVDAERGADDERIPLTPIRRTIAENMVRSAAEIPQAWTMMEADVTGMVRLRDRLRHGLRSRDGVNLTYMPFVLRAVASSLKEHPRINSSWGVDSIILKRRVNVGVAAATGTGLVVPVVHDADTLDLAGLARSLDGLVSRARGGKLSLSDVQGGTFTVNNTGPLGSIVGKPLINPPEAAIMNTEAVVKRPVVIDDAIAIRSMMNLTLSFDHRILDGAEAGAFLASVKRRLEAVGPDDAV